MAHSATGYRVQKRRGRFDSTGGRKNLHLFARQIIQRDNLQGRIDCFTLLLGLNAVVEWIEFFKFVQGVNIGFDAGCDFPRCRGEPEMLFA